MGFAEIWGFARAVEADIDAHVELGTAYPCSEITTSDMKMKAFGFTREKVMNNSTSMKYAKDKGIRVNFFAVDSSRTISGSAICANYGAALQAGRRRNLDGRYHRRGRPRPPNISCAVARFGNRRADPLARPQRFRPRNSGGGRRGPRRRRLVQGTINGMGERAGNADITKSLLRCSSFITFRSRLTSSKAREVSEIVQRRPATRSSPGSRSSASSFSRASRWRRGTIPPPSAIEPYSAESCSPRHVALGKKSGLNIKIKLERARLGAPPTSTARTP